MLEEALLAKGWYSDCAEWKIGRHRGRWLPPGVWSEVPDVRVEVCRKFGVRTAGIKSVHADFRDP